MKHPVPQPSQGGGISRGLQEPEIPSPLSSNKVPFPPTQNIHRHQVENLDFSPPPSSKEEAFPSPFAGRVSGSRHKQNIYLRLHNNTKKSRI